jgi:hypothetical protein
MNLNPKNAKAGNMGFRIEQAPLLYRSVAAWIEAKIQIMQKPMPDSPFCRIMPAKNEVIGNESSYHVVRHACGVLCIALAAPQIPTQTGSNELIDNAGWECVQGARIVDGKLIIASTEGFAPINDSVLRLQTGKGVIVSVTVETEMSPGFAGLNFWNSQPKPGNPVWWQTAAILSLGIAAKRPHVAFFDGTDSKPAFQFTGPLPVQGKVTLSAAREGDEVVIRIDGAEAKRTPVLGPLTGGPLFFGPNVGKGKTLTVHRIMVADLEHPGGAEIVHAMAPSTKAGAGITLRAAAAARNRLIGVAVNLRTLRWSQPAREIAAHEFNLLWGADAFGFSRDGLPWIRPVSQRK